MPFLDWLLFKNSKTRLKTFVDLKPHINLIDNFHYARNISLPGSIKDRYDIEFKISPPSKIELALHNDWNEEYGKNLLILNLFKRIKIITEINIRIKYIV